MVRYTCWLHKGWLSCAFSFFNSFFFAHLDNICCSTLYPLKGFSIIPFLNLCLFEYTIHFSFHYQSCLTHSLIVHSFLKITITSFYRIMMVYCPLVNFLIRLVWKVRSNLVIRSSIRNYISTVYPPFNSTFISINTPYLFYFSLYQILIAHFFLWIRRHMVSENIYFAHTSIGLYSNAGVSIFYQFLVNN